MMIRIKFPSKKEDTWGALISFLIVYNYNKDHLGFL